MRGVLVHVGAISMLRDLVATGHSVMLDEDGEVTVEPLEDLPENTLFVFEAL